MCLHLYHAANNVVIVYAVKTLKLNAIKTSKYEEKNNNYLFNLVGL